MQTLPPRVATLVLVDAAGTVLGQLPPFEADTPWWMDVAPLVRTLHSRDGLRVTILRLLSSAPASAHGGAVHYLAQLESGTPASLQTWSGVLDEQPLRHPYARVGGPQADLAWASAQLQQCGDALAGEPEQIRTWNLSSIWRLPTRSGCAWLKVVPPFFSHEGTLLAALTDAPVPRLLGHDGTRMLLADIAGIDAHDATLAERLPMIDLLVDLQRRWLGRGEALLALGLPDWRAPALSAAITGLVARRASELSPADRLSLATFVHELPARFAAVAACGLPEGLVHGDFHPGNVRSNAGALSLLDWGDSGIGHPLLDLPAFLRNTPPAEHEATHAHWFAAWQRALPDADPQRAAQLLAPVAAARQALIYQRFLDGIEPAEHPYHRSDVPDWLHRTAECLREEAAGGR